MLTPVKFSGYDIGSLANAEDEGSFYPESKKGSPVPSWFPTGFVGYGWFADTEAQCLYWIEAPEQSGWMPWKWRSHQMPFAANMRTSQHVGWGGGDRTVFSGDVHSVTFSLSEDGSEVVATRGEYVRAYSQVVGEKSHFGGFDS